MNSKKILITGGAGFIGSSLAIKLVASGHEVTVVDNLSPQIHGTNSDDSSLFKSLPSQVKFVRADVCDTSSWGDLISSQDALVHLAAETGTGQSMYEIKRYVDVNIGGTARILDWLAHNSHQVKRVVVASSRSIYGEGKYVDRNGQVFYPSVRDEGNLKAGVFDPLSSSGELLTATATDEESKIHPSSVYGITKQNQEQLVMTVCPTLGIQAVALRFQNVYGPGQSLKNPYTGILSIFSTRILNGNEIQIFEDGNESRDFVFISDVVNSIVLSLEKPDAANQVFGIGSGVATSVLEVARELISQYGKPVNIKVTGAFRVGDIRHNFADLGKARKMLGYEPEVSFLQGIRRFSSWVKSESVPEDNFEKSIQEMRIKGLFK